MKTNTKGFTVHPADYSVLDINIDIIVMYLVFKLPEFKAYCFENKIKSENYNGIMYIKFMEDNPEFLGFYIEDIDDYTYTDYENKIVQIYVAGELKDTYTIPVYKTIA